MLAFITICVLVLTAFIATTYRLLPLLRTSKHSALAFSPTELHLGEIFFAIVALIGKSLVLNALGFVRGSSKDGQIISEASGLSLSMPWALRPEDLELYASATGHRGPRMEELNNLRLAMFLSAVSEPAMLLLMTRPSCPVKPVGSVNVRNRFELLRPDLCLLETLEYARNGLVYATLNPSPRMVKRGFEVDLTVYVSLPDGKKGQHVTVFRKIVTMLQFAKHSSKTPLEVQQPTNNAELDPTQASVTMKMGFNDPSKWAAICKDYNLIHISGLAAKVYGFRGKIAHGNHVLAKAVEVSKDKATEVRLHGHPLWMEVSFKRPVFLPAELGIVKAGGSSGVQKVAGKLGIVQQSKMCVEASYGLL